MRQQMVIIVKFVHKYFLAIITLKRGSFLVSSLSVSFEVSPSGKRFRTKVTRVYLVGRDNKVLLIFGGQTSYATVVCPEERAKK